jgi:hypothetical protein
MSNWPEVLVKALAPGIAPTLDRLAEETRRVFWGETLQTIGTWEDTGEQWMDVQDLDLAAIRVLERTPTADLHHALVELWGLNEYALPYPTTYDTLLGNMLCGAAVPKDIMMDLLYGAIAVRCRLDEATEKEDLVRWRMRRLGRQASSPEVEAVTAALVGKTGPEETEPTFMTIADLVEHLLDDRYQGEWDDESPDL